MISSSNPQDSQLTSMNPTSDLVLAPCTLTSDVGASDSLKLFVLNTKEFVLRNEGEVFQHFVSFDII